jgi:hypothetical protein
LWWSGEGLSVIEFDEGLWLEKALLLCESRKTGILVL